MDHQGMWTEEFTVKSYDADARGTLKLQAIFNFLQEAAGNHATNLGVGHAALQKEGYFWVLSRIKIHANRLPVWHEHVTLTTWPKGIKGLFALRDFRAFGAGQELLFAAASAWLLLDTGRNKPQRLTVFPPIGPVRPDDHALPGSLEKLKPGRDLPLMWERKVMPSDLDVNKHVNNAEYARWIADCLDAESGGTAKEIQVNYLDEALLGDTIALHAGRDGDASWLCEGVSASTGSMVFQSKAELT
jgi:medium-chain acyl-[acyl-carrier-protein] hydrolase